MGKGPRSRPSSARPYPSSAAGEQQQLPAGLEGGSGGDGNASGGSGAVAGGGSSGGRGTSELSGRISGGRASGGSDGNGQVRRRSRSASLSRGQVEQADKQVNGSRAEPEVQQRPSATEGESKPFTHKLSGSCYFQSPFKISLLS